MKENNFNFALIMNFKNNKAGNFEGSLFLVKLTSLFHVLTEIIR